MMLCLALRSARAGLCAAAAVQRGGDLGGFAAARGLALPSQLRRALRTQGRDLSGEFLRLLPERPRPIKVQRWSPRRVALWLILLVIATVLGINYYEVVGNSEASRTPIHPDALDCPPTRELEPLWLEAQSVQSAEFVPCVASLPVGWSLGHVYANSGRASYTVDHDRAGKGALVPSPTDAISAAPTGPPVVGSRRYSRTGTPLVSSTDVRQCPWMHHGWLSSQRETEVLSRWRAMRPKWWATCHVTTFEALAELRRTPAPRPGLNPLGMTFAGSERRNIMEAKESGRCPRSPLLSWERVTARLAQGVSQAPDTGGPDRHTCWLATIDPDGSPRDRYRLALGRQLVLVRDRQRHRKGRKHLPPNRCPAAPWRASPTLLSRSRPASTHTAESRAL